MGLLVDGVWRDEWYDTSSTGGRFVRKDSAFRRWVTPKGDGPDEFPAATGRYHLYVSLACPWAHRTLIMRALKGLEEMISVSAVHWLMLEHGWTFEDGPGVIPDPNVDARYLYQVYQAADPHYTGRVTVPILWDRKTSAIVNNESAEILRMFGTAFDHLGAKPGDYYPEALRDEINALNERIYQTVNNGVYRAGFATTQAAYEEAIGPLFESLDWLDARLATRRFLAGEDLTEADIRLFTTLVRFDAVYVGHFKCNVRRIFDYPNLLRLRREIYALPGVGPTVNFQHIKGHYYGSHRTINPSGIVPVGPDIAI
jgi:putative glutathione S-transferase